MVETMVDNLGIQNILNINYGKVFGNLKGLKLKKVSIDSRSIQAGDLFLALEGPKNDGHNFIKEADSKGACCFVVEKKINTKKPYILVEDSYKFLSKLANYRRKEFKGKMICLTGSNGKTTTKEIIFSLLSSLGPCHRTKGNKNNQIGVPLTLTSLEMNNIFSVIEIGTSSPGEIYKLANIVKPDIGLITNAASSHLEGLGSVNKVAEEKGALLETLSTSGCAILPIDSVFFDEWKERNSSSRLISFGIDLERSGADVSLGNIKMDIYKNLTTFMVKARGEYFRCKLGTIGVHNALNAAAAFAVALGLDQDLVQLNNNLEGIKFPSGRLSVHRLKEGSLLIDDSYNANPESMKKSLDILGDIKGKKRFFVAGEMAELGSEEESFHQEICKYSEERVDELLCVGELWKEGLEKITHKSRLFDTKDKLLDYLKEKIGKDSVIMVKGSRSAAMDYIVDKLKL